MEDSSNNKISQTDKAAAYGFVENPVTVEIMYKMYNFSSTMYQAG
jgi:hypothetical protein